MTAAGFFPEGPDPNGKFAERALMDSNLDLSIVLLKAAELTGDRRYYSAADHAIESIVRHMKRPHGYVEEVDAATGEGSDNKRIFTKYITLLIKGFLLLDAARRGASIFERDLFLLARDR